MNDIPYRPGSVIEGATNAMLAASSFEQQPEITFTAVGDKVHLRIAIPPGNPWVADIPMTKEAAWALNQQLCIAYNRALFASVGYGGQHNEPAPTEPPGNFCGTLDLKPTERTPEESELLERVAAEFARADAANEEPKPETWRDRGPML